MPTQVQFRRGTTAQNAGFTGANGEISIDTSKKTVIVHDGTTPGGFPLAPNTAFDVANAAFNAQNADFTLSNASYDVANAAFGVANGAFAKANGALANTTNTVFQGNLTITGALTVGMNTTIINETSIIAQELYIGNSTSYVAVSSGTTTNAAFDVANAAFGKANAANVLAYDTGIGANAYAGTVGTSANNYAGVMANAANAYAASLTPDLSPAFSRANTAYDVANAAYGQANTLKTSANAYADVVGTSANNYAGAMANASNTYAASLTPNLAPPFDVANAAFDKANSANLLAYNTGIGANAYAGTVGTSSNNYAGVMANSVNAYTTATYYSKSGGTISGAVTINGDLIVQGNSYQYSSNTLVISDPLLYLAANNYTSDSVDIGFIANYVNATSQNVHTGIFRDAGSKEWFVFQGYDKEPDNNHIDPAGNNFAIAVLNADLRTSNLNLGGANAITWITSAYDKANSANVLAYNTGIGANAFATAVGTAGNAYAVTVGTSGNAYAVAVGAAGNVYAQAVGTSGNNYAATVGTSSNNYAGVMANSVNAYTSATYSTLTQLGQNWTVTNSAFTVANAAFAAANAKVASVTGTAGQIYSSGGTTPTVNLISSGVTASTYGGTTSIPVIVVDAFGRITSAANSGISAGDPTAAYNTANAAFGVANGAFAKANAAATAASPTFTGTVTTNANVSNQTLTDGATINWDVSLGAVATVTLGGNRTFAAPTNLKVGTYLLHVIQDGTGSRTITWNGVFKWPAAVAPTLTTTASRRDIISFVSDGTNLYGSFLPDVR